MKNTDLLLSLLILMMIILGCEKDNNEKEVDNNQFTIELGGKTFKSMSIDDFESVSDTSNWNIFTGGKLLIDTINKFNGQSSLYLVAIDHCFMLEKIEGVQVDKNKIYVLHFYYKMPPVDWGLCTTFMLNIKQANEDILFEVINGYNATNRWTEKYLYFQPINNIPAKIDILVGTTKGIWLDDLIVFEEY